MSLRLDMKSVAGRKFPEPFEIPSTIDELDQHVKRINYQALLWMNALEANQKIP